MRTIHNIEQSLQARQNDLAQLLASPTDLDNTEMRSQRRKLRRDCEDDIGELTAELARAHEELRSDIRVKERAAARAEIKAIERDNAVALKEWAILADLLRQAIESSRRLALMANNVNARLPMIITAERVNIDDRRGIELAQALASESLQQDELLKYAVASAVRDLLDAVPNGKSIQVGHLTMNPWAGWTSTPIATAAESAIRRFNDTLAKMCQEPGPAKSKVAV